MTYILCSADNKWSLTGQMPHTNEEGTRDIKMSVPNEKQYWTTNVHIVYMQIFKHDRVFEE